MQPETIDQLQKVIEVQQNILDIHPCLNKVFPIAIVEDGQFFIYDTAPSAKQYTFIKQAATPMPIPQGVRAAFPLESYDNRTACVVTSEIFDSLDGYVTIFHEFIHCQQSEICELKLKQALGIARKAQAAQDYMWELNYPFPYQAPEFIKCYNLFLGKMRSNDLGEVLEERKQLKNILSTDDYEYMVWQEWKEGFARFIENQINRRLGLQENHSGKEQPFTRVLFYEGGANFINILALQEPQLTLDIEILFDRMLRG